MYLSGFRIHLCPKLKYRASVAVPTCSFILLHNEGRLLGRTRGTRSRPRPRRWRPSSTPSCRPRSSRRTASCGASRSSRYIYTISTQYLRHIYMHTFSGLLHRLLQEGCGGFKAAARQPPLQQAGQGHGDLPGQYGWFVSTLRKSRVSTEYQQSIYTLSTQVRRELYAQCLDELIRQTTITCVERGLLLLRLRDESRITLHAYMVTINSNNGAKQLNVFPDSVRI